jgi:hypothetical protein
MIRDNTRYPKLHFPDQVEVADQKEPNECDISFFECITEDACSNCFFEMSTNSIDWAGVTQQTVCSTVIQTLQKNNFCKSLTTSNQDKFCSTFQSCVIFDNGGKNSPNNNNNNNNQTIDCSSLTECNWPGMHSSFIGDGVCHDGYHDSCYNAAICNYDGGDCCKDTCKTKPGAYLECGSDGYSCQDPNSSECDPTLSLKCPPSSYKKTSDDKDALIPTCTSDETLYRIVMLDSFGDGWEQTEMTVTEASTTKQVFKGGLKSGAEGTVYVCMSATPVCYNVIVSGGVWGREASWYVRGFSDGAPAIASGGGAMSCTFPVAGSSSCDNTCTGKSNIDPTRDPKYKDFKTMTKCIEDKCLIQLSECQNDPSCQKCFVENIPEFCFSINSFLAVNDCAMCKCTVNENSPQDLSDYCREKQAPGVIIPTPKNGVKPAQPVPCTPAETLAGATSLLSFSKCMDFDKNPLMMTDFDSNNFGRLDTFEACAHAYASKADHAGHTAQGCMQILVDTINVDKKDGEPTEVIAQLAKLLYADGLNFCDCSKTASNNAPLCPSFYNFKTILYESIDACTALDEIDCDAWDEFQKPCQLNIKSKYGSIDFARNNREQCDFVVNTCGGAGPFPSFRRLDCQTEIPQGSWDFYNQYKSVCLNGVAPVQPPVQPPIQPPIDPKTKPPTPYEPVKPSNIKPNRGGAPTPYSDGQPSNKRPSYRSPDEKKSHWFRNMIFVLFAIGIIYYCYKKQSDSFSFVRYRRMTNFSSNRGAFGMDDSDMYSGLSLESSTNFEPPTLPPTPMSMPVNGGYGA